MFFHNGSLDLVGWAQTQIGVGWQLRACIHRSGAAPGFGEWKPGNLDAESSHLIGEMARATSSTVHLQWHCR